MIDISQRSTRQAKSIVPIGQIEWEINELVKEYSDLVPSKALEIGSQHGGTLRLWMENLIGGGLLVSVDTGPKTWNPPQDFDNSIWFGWAADHYVDLRIITGNSHDKMVHADVVEVSPKYDFIFVDGDHSYEGSKKDFEMYAPLVRPGGIYAMHDLVTPDFSPHIQVWQFWREIQAAGYRTREIRAGANWGGIGVVYL